MCWATSVNLAARLMQAAEPGQVLAPQKLVDSTLQDFDWQTLPDISVKGKQATVAVRALIGPRARGVDAPETAAQLPMVGRDIELKQIEDRLALALESEGQIIGVTGEAGMGKSRLVSEAMRLGRESGMTMLWGQAESYGTNTSYLVWQTIWRGFFGIDQLLSASDAPVGPERVMQHLEAQLATIDERLVPRAPLLGAVLNLPLPDNELTETFDAKLRKTSLEALLADCLRARAAKRHHVGARRMPLD